MLHVEIDTLAQLEHENWIAYLAASISQSADGVVARDRGVVTLLGHVPMRFFNQILVERPTAEASAIGDAVDLGRARRDPFVVSLRDSVDDRFAPLMPGLDLRLADEAATLAMAMTPLVDHPRPASRDRAYEIRRVTDEAGLDDHRHTVTAGFGADPSVAEAMIGPGILGQPEAAIYVGYVSGRAVTAGFGWRTGPTLGVYNIATIPAARRRGFGEAMTAHILADGNAAGCEVAVLQASSMGRPIYERLGFREVLRYRGWVARPEQRTA